MTALDPQPTEFGTARIASQDELDRAILWRNNRAARQAKGAELRVALGGDPIAAQNARGNAQALIDFLDDLTRPPAEDFEYDDPPSNWGSNG